MYHRCVYVLRSISEDLVQLLQVFENIRLNILFAKSEPDTPETCNLYTYKYLQRYLDCNSFQAHYRVFLSVMNKDRKTQSRYFCFERSCIVFNTTKVSFDESICFKWIYGYLRIFHSLLTALRSPPPCFHSQSASIA